MSPGLAELPEDLAPEVSPLLDADTATWPAVASPVPAAVATDTAGTAPALSGEVKRHLLGGTSALGASVAVERGVGLVANILAARLGGKNVFGAYSFAVGTASQISMYAAGGIGATATRFSGKYPQSSEGYVTLRQALLVVSLVSAALAASGLWLGATPIAHLVGKTSMTGLLRWAALSSVGAILLECARGFFVGQRHLAALLVLSLLVGLGMLTLLPATAYRHNAQAMVVAQGTVAIAAVVICILLAKQLGLRGQGQQPGLPLGPMLREVWRFGGLQLASLIGSNLAGWWLTAVVARNDTSLVQISFLTIANQLRNLVALTPSLLTEGSYAVMADPRHEESKTPQRVMALCCYGSLGVSLLLGLVGMTVVPWLLALMYGRAYAGAGTTIALALATAVAHMGFAPAAARLTILSLRATAVINTIWALMVASAATLLMVRGGDAWQAMAVYFTAHLVSDVLMLLTLRRKEHLPGGMIGLFGMAMSLLVLGCVFSLVRSNVVGTTWWTTLGLTATSATAAGGLFLLGKRYEWLPSREGLENLFARVQPFVAGRLRRV